MKTTDPIPHPGEIDMELLARIEASPAPFAAWTERFSFLGRTLTTPDMPAAILDEYVRKMADTVATFAHWDAQRDDDILAMVDRIQADLDQAHNDANNATGSDTGPGRVVSPVRESESHPSSTCAGVESESGTGRIRSINDARSA